MDGWNGVSGLGRRVSKAAYGAGLWNAVSYMGYMHGCMCAWANVCMGVYVQRALLHMRINRDVIAHNVDMSIHATCDEGHIEMCSHVNVQRVMSYT